MSSFRSQFVTKRSYNRPLDEDGTIFETFTQTIDRVISHQRWLWETAKGKLIGEDIDQLTEDEEAELEEMRILLLNHEATVSGRTLWLGGTDISKKYHATQFNCSFGQIRTVHDFVDAFHNLLLGVGVGFEPITGILNGFARPVEIEIVRSTRKDRGDDNNREKHYRRGDKRVWHLYIGDSGIAWAKAAGKLVAMKKPVDIVILDFSEVRPGGKPLRGFGWISSGDAQISEAFYEIAQILNRRFGQLLSRIDVLDILNWLGTSLSSRRSAEIAIMPADDPEAEEFAIAKKDYWKTGNKQRAQSNNSLIFYHKPTKRELRGLFSQMLDSGGSEPGFINGAAARKRAPWFRGVNPCVSGDTLVYVADGRGNVSIKDLADEGKDVPVFCYDDNRKITIRTMRNPRITGENVPVYKLTLDDGSTIRTTENHKFLTKTGEYKELKDLVPGDSLDIITKYAASIKDIFSEAESNSQDYWWIKPGINNAQSEHRIIAEFHNNTKIPRGHVVHHRDYNAQNNSPDNLLILSKIDHDELHAGGMRGKNNPMVRAKTEWSDEKWATYKQNVSLAVTGEKNGRYSGYTNDDLKNHALILTNQLQRRFSTAEWMEYAKTKNLPLNFSKWRQDHLGGIIGLAKACALELGFDIISNTRLLKKYRALVDEGYNAEIIDDEILLKKTCEKCGDEFYTHRKEHGICSKHKREFSSEHKDHISQSAIASHAKRKDITAEKQVKIFNELRYNINRVPMKKEWSIACKINEISSEISRKSSPFSSYTDLIEAADSYNHKVISIEFCGNETVYNGTVDEFHNFFVGGFKSETKSGKEKFVYINNLQCGEILLGEKSYCNLVTINLAKFNGRWEELNRAFWIMGRANYRQTCVDFRDGILQETWHELNQFLRLTGVGCAGIVMWEHQKSAKHLQQLREAARLSVNSMAMELNLPDSKAVTCIKPDGCTILSTKIKLQTGDILSMEEIFELNGFNREFLALVGEKVWLQPEKELNVIDENNEEQKITKLYVNGIKPVYEIEFEDGNIYKFTGNHKLKTLTGWKRVDELTPDDNIISF